MVIFERTNKNSSFDAPTLREVCDGDKVIFFNGNEILMQFCL